MDRMTEYLGFIEKRATGQLQTPATWVRNFIRNHEEYKFDSVVTDSIAWVDLCGFSFWLLVLLFTLIYDTELSWFVRYDLMIACKEIGEGKRGASELLGDVVIKPILASDAYEKKLDSTRVVSNDHIRSLLQRYAARKTKFDEASAVEFHIWWVE